MLKLYPNQVLKLFSVQEVSKLLVNFNSSYSVNSSVI